MKKRILVLMLACVMVFTLVLAGCVKEQDTDEPAASDNGKEDASDDKDVAEEPVKLKFLTQESYRPQYPKSESPVLEDIADYANVEIEFVTAPPNDQVTQLAKTTLAAGVNLPDMIYCRDFSKSELINLKETETIVAISPYFEEYGQNIIKKYIEKYPNDYLLNIFPDGEMYWLGNIGGGVPSQQPAMLINKNWLEDLNVDIPETIDEFYSMLRTFQDKDANENGKKDEIWSAQFGQFLRYTPPSFGAGVLSTHPNESFMVSDDGTVYNSYATEGTRKWLTWIQKVYKEGLLDQDIVTIDKGKLFAKVCENKISCSDRPPYQVARFVAAMQGKGFEDAMYTWASALEGPEGDIGSLSSPAGLRSKVIVTKDSEHPEACVKYFDAYYSDYGETLMTVGVKGDDWVEKADGTIDASVFYQRKEENPDYGWVCGQASSGVPKYKPWTWEAYVKMRHAETQLGFDLEKAKEHDEFSKSIAIHTFNQGVPVEEETKLLEQVDRDLWVYMEEMLKKFITCNASMDEWDAYVEKCNELGLDKATEANQMMYDRLQELSK